MSDRYRQLLENLKRADLDYDVATDAVVRATREHDKCGQIFQAAQSLLREYEKEYFL